jgi:phage tail protein X
MSTPQFIEHITTDGDRWDLLAWRYYGDPHGYERIITANPELPITPRLAGGIKVRIPVIPDAPAATAGLPPWKRDG